MEVFAKYGNEKQKKTWLQPLLQGTIRSAFAMTEYNVPSSDALNIATTIERTGDDYIINGHKWYISGVGHPNFKVYLVLGKMKLESQGNKRRHTEHTLIIVPADTAGIQVKRPLHVFGYDDANHGHFEVVFNDVRVPINGTRGEGSIILGEGRGFEVIQGRLGPGRIHHCMRSLGMAERALEITLTRILGRGKTFGTSLDSNPVIRQMIAQARMKLDQARYLTWHAAKEIDRGGSRMAMLPISMIKVVVPNAACEVVDTCIQLHGAMGVSQDTILPRFYAGLRTLRIADGTNSVHIA
jgi:acyl-CoA dehydrogenase